MTDLPKANVLIPPVPREPVEEHIQLYTFVEGVTQPRLATLEDVRAVLDAAGYVVVEKPSDNTEEEEKNPFPYPRSYSNRIFPVEKPLEEQPADDGATVGAALLQQQVRDLVAKCVALDDIASDAIKGLRLIGEQEVAETLRDRLEAAHLGDT